MQDAIQLFGVGADDYIYILHSVSPFVITILGISNLSINSMTNQNSFPYRFWSSTESWRVSRVNDKPLVIRCCYVYYIWLNSQHPRRRVSVLLIMYACVRTSACVRVRAWVRLLRYGTHDNPYVSHSHHLHAYSVFCLWHFGSFRHVLIPNICAFTRNVILRSYFERHSSVV